MKKKILRKNFSFLKHNLLEKCNKKIIKLLINNYFIFLNFFILLFFFTFIIFYINQKREIILGSDDNYHYLTQATNLNECYVKKCHGLENIVQTESLESERQIHRLVFSYTPLYTFFLSKFIEINNKFFKHKIFYLLSSIFLISLIVIFLKQYLKEKETLLLTLFISIYYVNFIGPDLRIFPYPSQLSIFLSILTIPIIHKQKTISLLILFISILIHKIGIITGLIIFFISFLYPINVKLIKKNIYYILIYLLLIFISEKVRYNYNITINKNTFNLYSLGNDINSILNFYFTNIVTYIYQLFKTIFLLNPILLFFFFKNLLYKNK